MKLYREIAINNSYDLVFNGKNLNEFQDINNNYFIHNPKEQISIFQLQEMFDYFLNNKNYDKCVAVRIKISILKYKDEFKKLSDRYHKESL